MKKLALILVTTSLVANSLYSTKYDKDIKQAVLTYWKDYPKWQLYKAQLYQESLLNSIM